MRYDNGEFSYTVGEDMDDAECVLLATRILKKYAPDSRIHLAAEHDVLYMFPAVDPDEMTQADKDALEADLGCHFDGEVGTWATFL